MGMLRLDSFDPHPDPAPADPLGDDWHRGYAAGLAAAMAEHDADQARLHEDVTQALADLRFSYADARRTMLQELAPLFHALVGRLLPDLRQEVFAANIRHELGRLAAETLDPMPVVALAPATIDWVEATCAQPPIARFVADPDLAPGQAVIATASGRTALDTNALIDSLGATLLALVETPLGQLSTQEVQNA